MMRALIAKQFVKLFSSVEFVLGHEILVVDEKSYTLHLLRHAHLIKGRNFIVCRIFFSSVYRTLWALLFFHLFFEKNASNCWAPKTFLVMIGKYRSKLVQKYTANFLLYTNQYTLAFWGTQLVASLQEELFASRLRTAGNSVSE